MPLRGSPFTSGTEEASQFGCVPLAMQLLDEGAVQLLRERNDDGNGNPILAAVGTLQFEGELPCAP